MSVLGSFMMVAVITALALRYTARLCDRVYGQPMWPPNHET